MSKKIAYRWFLDVNASCICDSRSARAMSVDLDLRKPYCDSENLLFDSKNQTSLLLMIFSNVSARTLVSEMGRYDLGSEAAEEVLRIGMTIAVFQISG